MSTAEDGAANRIQLLYCLIVVLALAMAGLPISAQGHLSGFVTGRVVVDDGSFIPGATIEIQAESRAGGSSRTLVTNSQGRFFATHLPPGEYKVRASFDDLVADPKLVSLRRGKAATVDLVLTKAGAGESPVALHANEPPSGFAQRVELTEYFRQLFVGKASASGENTNAINNDLSSGSEVEAAGESDSGSG